MKSIIRKTKNAVKSILSKTKNAEKAIKCDSKMPIFPKRTIGPDSVPDQSLSHMIIDRPGMHLKVAIG